jgi:hypothetical protein
MSTATNVRRTEQKALTFFTTGKSVKFLGAGEIPRKTHHRGQKWLELLKQIPEGAAIAATKAELGIAPTTVKIMVARFKKDGSLSKKYYTTSRTTDGKETVYVVHGETEE